MYISIFKPYHKKIKNKYNIQWVSLKNNTIEIYMIDNKYKDRYSGKLILTKISNKKRLS